MWSKMIVCAVSNCYCLLSAFAACGVFLLAEAPIPLETLLFPAAFDTDNTPAYCNQAMNNTIPLHGKARVVLLSRLLGAILFSQVNTIFIFANIYQCFQQFIVEPSLPQFFLQLFYLFG